MSKKSTFVHKIIDKAQKDRAKLAEEYGVSESSVVWLGDNKYIVVKNGVEIRI